MAHTVPPNRICNQTFHVLKIQNGGRPSSLKIEKRSYLRNGLTDRHKVWHDDAYWPSEP